MSNKFIGMTCTTLILLMIPASCPAQEATADSRAVSQSDSQTSDSASADSLPGQMNYQQAWLDNGLEIVTLEDFSCPIVAVHLWYHVGSKDEDPERQGFAHMFEHMMFRGTDRLGSTDHFDFIRKTGGTTNAYTTFDQTVYTQTLPANQLNLALWLEAERMSMLKIDQEAFDTERKVVEEERRVGLNRPYGQLREKTLPFLFENHPYRWSTIGSIPHLRSASVPELREFWKTHYVPNNATLIVVGAVKHEEVVQLARRNFGWIPRCADPPRIAPPDWKPFKAQEMELKEKNAPAPLVQIYFRGVPLNHPDATAIDVMAAILGRGSSSRLYRRLVADDELAVGAFASAMNLEQDGTISTGAVLSPVGGDMEKAIKALHEEIEKMQRDVVEESELEKVQNQLLRRLITESLTVDSKAAALGAAAVLEGDVSRVNTRLQRIRDVSVDDIQRVAQQYLSLDNALTFRVNRNIMGSLGSLLNRKGSVESTPITGEPETDPPAPGRAGVERPLGRIATAPVAGLLDFETQLDYEQITLDNGLTIVVVENHEIPYVSTYLGFQTGARTEAKPGTASLAMSMLTKGTERMSEKELSDELAFHAITLAGSASMDTVGIGVGCLSEQMDRAIKLLSEVVVTPTMPDDEFRKLVKQTRTGLMVGERTPTAIAQREFRRRLYGDHPYARPTEGESSDLDVITADDARLWWKLNARPDVATIVFAGDIDLATAGTLVKKYMIDWQVDSDPPLPATAEFPEPADTHIYLVDHAGVQSQIRAGHRAFTRRDPAYFTSRVVNGYFGGAFSSRLNDTIRVKKGLTYGANGGFRARQDAGSFTISTFSKNASVAEAVSAIIDEVKRLQTERPSEKELQNTIAYFLGSYPAGRETPQQVASDVWFLKSLGLPSDYFQLLIDSVKSTTADECLALAQQHVRPEQLIIVVVGPAEELRESLEAIAPVTVVSKDEEVSESESE